MSLIRHKVNVKARTLDIAPLRESSPQKRSGMARVCSQGISHFNPYTHGYVQSAIEMSYTCLCLPIYSWYSFRPTDPGEMEGRVGLGGWLRMRQLTCPKAVM